MDDLADAHCCRRHMLTVDMMDVVQPRRRAPYINVRDPYTWLTLSRGQMMQISQVSGGSRPGSPRSSLATDPQHRSRQRSLRIAFESVPGARL
jgi:hypothetical protein